MQRYRVQTHIHGSSSEGLGSYTAHDFAASQAGHVDLIWWHDHDWRVANFAKVRHFDFDTAEEWMQIPNRDPHAEPLTTPIKIFWEPVLGNTADGEWSVSTDIAHTGSGSFRLTLPAGAGMRAFFIECKAEVMHAKLSLLSHPHVRIAVYTAERVGNDCLPVVRMRLSQQPPDLESAYIVYLIGKTGPPTLTGNVLEIPIPVEKDGWQELALDPADDVLHYGLQGGLDNSLYAIQIGVVSDGPQITSHFDSLQIEPEYKGTECLTKLRQMINESPLQTPSHVGIEVSYYGQHINAFGSNVPIPDYENVPRSDFTSRYIVDHIHQYGGLACLNHPGIGNIPKAVDTLVRNQAFDVDLIEVAHANGWLLERLTLFDRLASYGLTLTGIAASDAHGAEAGWGIKGKAPAWVNHIWAKSLKEADLLEAMALGRVCIADPAQFSGTLALNGPEGVEMGDVVECAEYLPLTVHITGLQSGDIVIWVVNGLAVHASVVDDTSYHEEWTPKSQLLACPAPVRVQVIRPSLAGDKHGGMIVFGNPIYFTKNRLTTRHRMHTVSVSS